MTLTVSLRHRAGGFNLDVDFEVARPGVTALFGPSGAGKTTIVNAIAGLLKPQAGRIVIDGETVLDTAQGLCVPAPQRRVGYVFQDARLFPHLSVEKNLRFGWRRAQVRADRAQFDEIIGILGLAPLLKRRSAGLSGGEKNRVALGRALLASPRLLLLDEPLAALDAARKRDIFPWLERLRDLERLPMIYVTHSTDEVARLADQMVVLEAGRVMAQGSVFDLLSDPALGTLVPAHGAVFPARVTGHRDDGLTTLAFDGGCLYVPRLDRRPGALIRVRLLADDIMLAREAPRDISANNILPVEILSVHGGNPDRAEIRLRSGGVNLVSHITRASRERLALKPGENVFAIVKSVTIDPQLDAPD